MGGTGAIGGTGATGATGGTGAGPGPGAGPGAGAGAGAGAACCGAGAHACVISLSTTAIKQVAIKCMTLIFVVRLIKILVLLL